MQDSNHMNLRFGFDNDFETRSVDHEHKGRWRYVTFRSVSGQPGKWKRYLNA